MRTLQSLIVAHLVLTCVAVATAQDQFFRVNMNGPSALPSNNSREVGDGFFTLSSNLFLGGAGPIDGRLTPTVLRIQHASGRLIFETREIEYRIPYPEEDYAYYIAYRSFGVGLVLTSNLMDEVVQGQWYVTIASEQYPNGEIRGQIVPTPNPEDRPFFLNDAGMGGGVSYSLIDGQSHTFAVLAVGNPPPAYRWIFNGTNIPGATSTEFTITNMTPAQAGVYTVLATNLAGYRYSSRLFLSYFATGAAQLTYPLHTPEKFSFWVSQVSGQRYVIYGSVDLVSWTPVVTNTAPFGVFQRYFPIRSHRFYRAKLVE
jgi:hypothetical protein